MFHLKNSLTRTGDPGTSHTLIPKLRIPSTFPMKAVRGPLHRHNEKAAAAAACGAARTAPPPQAPRGACALGTQTPPPSSSNSSALPPPSAGLSSHPLRLLLSSSPQGSGAQRARGESTRGKNRGSARLPRDEERVRRAGGGGTEEKRVVPVILLILARVDLGSLCEFLYVAVLVHVLHGGGVVGRGVLARSPGRGSSGG